MDNTISFSPVSAVSYGQTDWRQFLLNWTFPCPSCRQVGILRTDREFQYECRHCGDIFDIRDASGPSPSHG
jgi:rubredoxin